MKLYRIYSLALLLIPGIASAQGLELYVTNFSFFLGNTVIPFLISIAFLFFVYNAIRFFVVGASKQEEREKAKRFALYAIAAFVIISVFWGIVNALASAFDLNTQPPPQSDYLTL